MVLFWISTLIIVLLSAVFIAIPLVRKQVVNDAERRDELNKVIYKERVAELFVEDEEGIVVDKEELITDLKQALLDDIPSEQKLASTTLSSPVWVAVVSTVLLFGISYGFYAKFGGISQVQNWQAVSANLPELSKKLMSGQGEPMSEDELKDLTLALRTSLHKNSNDATGWLLLGRIGLANRGYGPLLAGPEGATVLFMFKDGRWPAITIGNNDGSSLGSEFIAAHFEDKNKSGVS